MNLGLMDLAFVGSLGGTTLWTPAQITTALWLDAADASTITTVSGVVSQWNDKSGNARHATQAITGSRPSYTIAGQNGLNVITLDGSNDYFILPNTTNPTGANATFVACKPNHSTTTGFIIGRAYNWGSWYLLSFSTGTAASYHIGRNGIDEANAAVSGFTNNTDKIFSATYNNSNVSLAVNGNTPVSTPYTPNPIYNSNDATSIGAALNTSGTIASSFKGSKYEIIVLHYMPSTNIIQGIEGYLAHKWGLTANLPSGHPYKTAPPYV